MKTTATKCPACLTERDGATAIDGGLQLQPSPGDLSICFYCGGVAVFGTENGMRILRRATMEDLDQLSTEQLETVHRMQRRIVARVAHSN